MEPLEIHIPLKIVDDKPIKFKIVDNDLIKLKVSETGGAVYPVYTGETVVTPKVHESTELETAKKTVLENIIVEEIPYYETSNIKGTTFIVGG